MKKFCQFFREHAMKKKMIPLTNEQEESYENAKIRYICKKIFRHKYSNDKTYHEVRNHRHYTGKYRGAGPIICNLKYSKLKEISVIFHNKLNYDYYFIIKELAKEFEGYVNCLGENTKKNPQPFLFQ